MRRKIALFEEICDHALLEGWRAAVDRRTHGPERVDQIGRNHEIADPVARQQGLAERAGVENPIGLVEAVERGDRMPLVSEFAVVIILDDPAAVLLRIGEKAEPSRKREDRSDRILVGGRHVEGSGGWHGAGLSLSVLSLVT